jgi:formiminotetrahydrofolate cyclodeaminase
MAAGITLEKLGDDAASGEGGLRAELAAIAEEARRLSGRFESLEDEDVAAFAAYLAALRLPRATPEEKERRRAARAGAAARATEAPLATLETARRTLDLAGRLLQLATRHPIKAESDVGAAIELAAAAFRTAELNVRVNLPEVAADRRAEFERRWQGLREPFEALYTKLRTTLGERLGP